VCRCTTTTSDLEPAPDTKPEPITTTLSFEDQPLDISSPPGLIRLPPTPVSPTGEADIPFGPSPAATTAAASPFVAHPHRPRPSRPQDLRRISTSNLARSTATPTPFSPSPGPSASPSPNSSLQSAMARPASVMGLAAGPPLAQSEHYHPSPQSSPQPSPAVYSAGPHAAPVAWHSPVQHHPLSQAHSPETAFFPSLPQQSGPPAAMAPPPDPAQPPPDSVSQHGLLSMDGLDGLVWSIAGQTYPAYTLDPTPADWDWEAISQLEGSAATPASSIAPVDYPRSPVDSVHSRRSTESSLIHPFPSSRHPSPPSSSRSDSAPRTLESVPYPDGTMMMAGHAPAEAAMTMPAHAPPPAQASAANSSTGPPPDHNLAESPSWSSSMTSPGMHQYQALAAYYHQAHPSSVPAPAQVPLTAADTARMHMEVKPDPSPPQASRLVPRRSASATTLQTGPQASAQAAAYSAQLAFHQTMAMRRVQHAAQAHSVQVLPQEHMAVGTVPPGPSSAPAMGGMYADYPVPVTYMHQAFAMPLQQPPVRQPAGRPPVPIVSQARPSVQPIFPPHQPVRSPPASAGPGPAPRLPIANAPYGAMGPPLPLSAPADAMGMHGFFEALPQATEHPAAMHHPGPAYLGGLQQVALPTRPLHPSGSAPPHLTTFGMHPVMVPRMSMGMGMDHTPPPLLSQE
jgi:hypothetical protein